MADGEIKLTMKGGQQMRAMGGQFRKKIVGAALDEMVTAWGTKAVAELREATPVEKERPDADRPRHGHPRPGSARESWRWDHVPSQHAVKVTNTQPYTLFLFSGTEPHIIEPLSKTPGGYLVFFWMNKGRWAKPPYVSHPGTEPVEALVDAMNRLNQTAEVMFHQTAEKIMTTIMQPISVLESE